MRFRPLVLSACVGLVIVLLAPLQAADQVIRVQPNQDGAIYGAGGAPELSSGNLWVGAWASGPGFWSIGLHWLTDDGTGTGAALTTADVPQALLLIPECDAGGGSVDNYNTLTLSTYHIDAIDDSTLSAGDDTSADLGLIGTYRLPGPTNKVGSRFVQFDVTDRVHADINAARGTFAWRVQQNPVSGLSGYRAMPSVENGDTYFGTLDGDPLTDNHGARLIIKELGTVEGICDDGLDDDGDSLIDCADPDCSDRAVCPENCSNSIDDDADGDVDCADSECAGDPACPETICNDGLDNDGDASFDCDDIDCTDSFFCPEICDDTIDNDADGDVDCDDSECANFSDEPCVETKCNDGLDGDGDGWIDCLDTDCATSFVCGGGTVCIRPTSNQDADVYGGNIALFNPFGRWGKYNSAGYTFVTIHTLPVGITSADIGSATLQIARTDNGWTGNASSLDLNMLLKHIDANDDTTVTLADGTSAPLADVGLYRAPGPYFADNSRSILFNVTDLVRADIDAGRLSFAHRVEPESVSDDVSSQRYMPSIDNTDGAFPADIRGATLCLTAPGVNEDNCTDGIDNNVPPDGLIDCADPYCTDDPACPEDCTNGIDDDTDGDIDCDDAECLSSPSCPEGVCDDGLDNDDDGDTDCSDSDCFGAFGCQSEFGFCGDGFDNDNDCLTDGGDPDCGNCPSPGIYPAGPQDGWVTSDASIVATDGGVALWGSWDTANQIQVVQAGIHTLPAIANPADVVSAELRIPEASVIWSAGGLTILDNAVDVLHIDAADDTQVSLADGNSVALSNLGSYRSAEQAPGGRLAFTSLDVTAAVQADLTAARATFAWRLNVLGTLPLGSAGENNPQLWSGSVESTDPAFGTTDHNAVTDNHGARLILCLAGTFENDCTDTVDNDADGAVDCDDADCYNDPACNLAGEASCGDGVDNDGDNDVDCDDTDCLGDPCCGPLVEICTNGVDDDDDTLVDCDDPDCACAANCGPFPAETCDNSLDDDCDGDTDCADSDCTNDLACLGCNDPYADANGDTFVGPLDFALFQLCVTGTGGGVPAGCECWDRAGTPGAEINEDDYSAFLNCHQGSVVVADTACDD